jgi:hypothetical protein
MPQPLTAGTAATSVGARAHGGTVGKPASTTVCGDAASAGAPRGGGGLPRGAALRPKVAGPPRYARTAAHRGTAVERSGERGGARARWRVPALGVFRVATFDSEKL